jgi:hypothetical protein
LRKTSSNYKGVSWLKNNKRWAARIKNDLGKWVHIGCYSTEDEAVTAIRNFNETKIKWL